jgi:hypothetical protein
VPSSVYYAAALSRVGSKAACSCISCPVNDWDAIQAIDGGTRGTRRDAPQLGARSGTRRGRDVPLSWEP